MSEKRDLVDELLHWRDDDWWRFSGDDMERLTARAAEEIEELREKARKYDWLHDSIEHAGHGQFTVNLGGIEVDSETDETIFDWLVEQAMKNEERNAEGKTE